MSEELSPSDHRMESFYREIEEVSDYNAELYDTEVAVSIVEDEDTLSVDLRPAITAGFRYGLVVFDGKAGNSTAALHFKPQEHIRESGGVDTDSPAPAPHIPGGMAERTYYAIIDVADRWGITMSDAEAFLEDVGFFDAADSSEPAGQKRVVVEFRHRQPDDPTTLPKGGLPEMDPGETTATCWSCGCFGIVPDDAKVVNADAPDTDTVLICATCAENEKDSNG